MVELSGLQVFKYLPAAKKLPEGNCKNCGAPTCMAFALKLAKGQIDIAKCPFIPDELNEIFSQSMKVAQKTLNLGLGEAKITVGGENVLFRHEKTFVNKTPIGFVLDTNKPDFQNDFDRIVNFEITRINETFKVDFVYCKEPLPVKYVEKLNELSIAYLNFDELNKLNEVADEGISKTVSNLVSIREKAILEKKEEFSTPVYVHVGKSNNILEVMTKGASYLCKYANLLLFDDFNEAFLSTLLTLRQNIYTDPQKTLQVESKIYEFNNPDENALVFLSTNFALTYFAVANEIESLDRSAYLIVTPSEGMSVLTAWSAEKITSQMIAKMVKDYDLASKVKNKIIILPGLLAHMKDELDEAIPEFDFQVGAVEAYMIGDMVKKLNY